MIDVRRLSRHPSTRSKPLLPGRLTSRSTKSGAKALATLAATLPSETHCTSKPSNDRLSFRTRVSTGSSSTTSTRFFITTIEWCLDRRQCDDDPRSFANSAPNVELSAMVGDDPVHDGESESAAARRGLLTPPELPCYTLDVFRGNADALVRDLQRDGTVPRASRNRQMMA